MSKKFRTLFMIACTVLLIVSLFQIGLKVHGYFAGQNTYDAAESSFGVTTDSDLEIPAPVTEISEVSTEATERDPLIEAAASYFESYDFDALKAINDEIIGWIVIPETNISYPICQHDDNQYYLEHTYEKEANFVGSIFADYRVSHPFEDYNTILYGHRLLNQTMFSALKTYRDKETWEKNPYIFIYTPDAIRVYEIYSAFSGDPDGISYNISFSSEEDRQAFIGYTLSCAEYDTGIVPATENSFLTLSTCIGTDHSQRMIVHSVLVAYEKRTEPE